MRNTLKSGSRVLRNWKVTVSFENLIETPWVIPRVKAPGKRKEGKESMLAQAFRTPKCTPEGAPRLLCTPHHHLIVSSSLLVNLQLKSRFTGFVKVSQDSLPLCGVGIPNSRATGAIQEAYIGGGLG